SPALQSPRSGYRYADRGVREAVRLIVFGTSWGMALPPDWPHAAVFTDVLEEWVHTVGHYPEPFGYLLTYLDVPGWAHAPEPALRWLHEIMHHVSDPQRFWADHTDAARTASLLQRMLEQHGRALWRDSTSLRRLSDLADRLALTGSPVAASLQR